MKLSLVQLCCSSRRRRLGRCGRRRRRPGGGRRGSGCATVQAPTTWDRLARPAGEGLWSTQANHTSANWPRHSLHYQYCQSICTLPTPNPFVLHLKCESLGQWEELSPQVCPSYCAAPPPARAAALLQPARHHTTLPFEQHTADSFSRSKFQLRRPFLPPADAGRPTTRGLNSCGTNMT